MTPMLRTELDALLDDILSSRRLLAHPFYRRWEAGTLQPGELATYAAQYRHFEAALPVVLERIAAALPDGRARQLVEDSLADERGVPAPHLELFDSFADAVGAVPTDMTPATRALVDLYLSAADASPVAALSAVAAYEVQAPDIAVSKAEGLRSRYGLDDNGTRFWDVHAGIDEAVCDLRVLLEWVEREETQGLGEAPYPPNFPKMPGEPKRVPPSRAKKND